MPTTPISLFAVVGIAAITPGPNNMIVMTLAAKNGLVAASQALVGVLSGTLLLLFISNVALTLAMTGNALGTVTTLIAALGSAYFAWLGFKLIKTPPGAPENHHPLPSSALAILGFQLVNPKAWMLAMTVAATAGGVGNFWRATFVTLLISGLCLSTWMFSGIFIARMLHTPGAARLFEIAIGGVLLVTAIMLARDVLGSGA